MIRYGYLEELPVVFRPETQEAWTIRDGAWVPMEYADAATKAKLISASEFAVTFGADNLPPLPR